MIKPNTPIRQPWEPSGRRPIIQSEFRGINTLEPFSIEPTFATSVKNLTSAKYPVATTRPGYSVSKKQGTKVLGLGVWKDTELHAIFDDGTWWRLKNGAWDQLASGLSTAAEYSFSNFKGNLSDINLIATNGVGVPRRYDGSTVTTLSGGPTGLNYIEQHVDRLWGVVGNELKASEYRVADKWETYNGDAADSWYAVVETPDGEQINAIRGGLSKLTIGKPNSLHELFGYSPFDYSVRTVTMEMGPINNKCMLSLKGTMFILHTTGLFQYSGGTLPDDSFSTPIQGFIKRMNLTDVNAPALGTDGEKIYVSIPINGAQPDTILEYDPKFGTWYVWEGVPALHFATLGPSFYVGDTSGRVNAIGGSTDAGSALNYEWVSKPFTGQSMSQVIRWIRAWITAKVPTGSTMEIYLSKTTDGDDWTLVGSVDATANITDKPIYIRSNMVANAKMIRLKIKGTGPVDIYEFSREEEQMPIR